MMTKYVIFYYIIIKLRGNKSLSQTKCSATFISKKLTSAHTCLKKSDYIFLIYIASSSLLVCYTKEEKLPTYEPKVSLLILFKNKTQIKHSCNFLSMKFIKQSLKNSF